MKTNWEEFKEHNRLGDLKPNECLKAVGMPTVELGEMDVEKILKNYEERIERLEATLFRLKSINRA